MKITMTAIIERQCARFYIHKKPEKLRKVFIYKMPDTFQKARQFPLRFYISKVHTLYVTGFLMKFLKFAFIYKKLDTSQKAIQFAIRFCIQNPELCVTRFFIEFLK